MSLTDQFNRPHTYLRIAVTDRCNLRCSYCMPHEGIAWQPRHEILSLEEIARIAQIFVANGVRKIRLTGGEPLVRSNVEWLVRELSALPELETLAMTTNGTLLAARAEGLKASGLNRLNISLDSLKRDSYAQITGHDMLPSVFAGINAAVQAGFDTIKLNTVVMAGVNDDELFDFVDLTGNRPLHVRFIEYMPFPGNKWGAEQCIPWNDLLDKIQTRYNLDSLRSNTGEVARSFQVPGHLGTVSFISPLSDEFCSNCNRIRLTADGSVKSCLLFPAEVSLRDALRSGMSDEELLALIRQALQQKNFSHPTVEDLVQLDNRCMTQIGG